ncbi:MAG: hypothetical protein WBM13_04490, partial [Bacteroidia bacterium]
MSIIKKMIILPLILIFSAHAYSQVWCPEGATWYYTDASADWFGYSKLAYVNDTVINSITCKKITHYYEGTGILGSASGYRNPY